MYQVIYPTLLCVLALCYALPIAAQPVSEQTLVQSLPSVKQETKPLDWKQANEDVAKLGGWQYYASEAGGHQGMDHSKHSMPMDDSEHTMPMDHSKHSISMDDSKHTMPMDHSKHSMPMEHSKHSTPIDDSKPALSKPATTGDKHEHHH